MTNLVQFPGLGLSFELDRVAFSIGGMNIYWYGVCIAVGMCLALVFAFRHSVEFGVDADAMVDVILIGVVMGILCARLYYVATASIVGGSAKLVKEERDKAIQEKIEARSKKSVFAQNQNLSISGSDGKFDYYLSGRFYSYDGLFDSDEQTDKFTYSVCSIRNVEYP